MYKIYCYNVFYDLWDFIKRNCVKFILAAAFFLLAVILGIRNALSITDAAGYLFSHDSSGIGMISGSGSGFSYFFVRFLTLTAVTFLIALLSFHVAAAWLDFALLAFYAYSSCLYITLYIVLFKIAVLPLLLLCLIPCFLAAYVLLAFLSVLAFNRALEIKQCGCCGDNSFRRFLRRILPLLIMLGIICILEALLAYFLTLGIIL